MTLFEQIWGRARETGIGGVVVVAKPETLRIWREHGKACGREDDLIVCSELPPKTTE